VTDEEATTKTDRAEARSAGARPSSEARPALRRLVAFTPEAGGFYVGAIFRGADQVCRSRNAQLILVQHAVSWQAAVFHPAPLDDYLRIAADYRDGFIAMASVLSDDELELMRRLRGPSASIAGPPFHEDGASVVSDNAGGTALAVQHLIDHGHKRIGFVGAMGQFDVRRRYESYLATLEKAGIQPDPALTYAVQDDLTAGGREAAEAIIEAGLPLTAIFASTDTQGVALMDRVRAADVRVPADLAIVGFDDSELAQTAVPALTSVRQVPEQLGSTAAGLVLDALDGKPPEPGVRVIPTQLVQRHSCGCLDNYQHLLEAAADWNEPDWQERLAAVLAHALVAPSTPMPASPDRSSVWPSASVVVDALDDAIRGRRMPDVSKLDEAWWEASTRTRNAETLLRLVDLLEFVALCRQPEAGSDPDALRTGLRDFLSQSRLQILRSAAIADPMRHPSGPRTTRTILRSFLEDRRGARQGIDWLAGVDARAGCLALWEHGPDERPSLRIEALYGETGGTQGGGLLAPESFPPRHWLDANSIEGDTSTIMITPVISPQRNIGVLATILPSAHRFYDGYWNLQYAAAMLALSLENRA
jgi:DNA-binding LacI/PurR family transcriptional regulator